MEKSCNSKQKKFVSSPRGIGIMAVVERINSVEEQQRLKCTVVFFTYFGKSKQTLVSLTFLCRKVVQSGGVSAFFFSGKLFNLVVLTYSRTRL
jgi:hypothetical protein